MANPQTITDSDRALLDRAALWPAHRELNELTRTALAQIAACEGIDFATALLYDRLLRGETVRDTLERVFAPAPLAPRDVLVGIVPGAFYKEYAFTGADGQRVLDAARQHGFRAERVPVDSFGSLERNANHLRAWLAQHDGDEICLVSLSKGGADVQYALSAPDADQCFRNVSTWISISGIIGGTALANWLLGQWWRSLLIRAYAWWRRYPFEVVHDIKRDGNALLENSLTWPVQLRVFHLIGFPLRAHLDNAWAMRAHSRLEAWGPSDAGGILLADAVRWPGTIIPLWGVDHYLQQNRYDVASMVLRLVSMGAPEATEVST